MAAFSSTRAACLLDLPHDISVNYITDSEVSLKSRQQGYRYFSESYIHGVKLFKTSDNTIQASAKCHRSQRKNEKPHGINVDISPGRVDMAHCSCVAGSSGCCSHVVGLLLALQEWLLMGFTDVPGELSSTSLPQKWSVPRGDKIAPEPVPRIVIVKPHADRKQKPVENKIIDCRNIRVQGADLDHLKSMHELPIGYLTNTPDKRVTTHLGTVGIGSGLSTHAQFYTPPSSKEATSPVGTACGNLAFPYTPLISLPQKFLPLPVDVRISDENAKLIEETTRGQSKCARWFEERKTRLTASKFSQVTKRKTFSTKFVKELLHGRSFTSNATAYGTLQESTARQSYIRETGNHVHDCGLIVNPEFPFLGASPDGKICENKICGILEIKCPYSARDLTIDDALKLPNFCLESQDVTKLKQSHEYFCQVQGQLLVTGASFCDFVLYTRKSLHIERIYPNTQYMTDLLCKLTNIYFTHVYDILKDIALRDAEI